MTSLLRGLRTAVQNLPTMVRIIEEDYEEAVRDRNNTKGKELQKKLKQMKDPENILIVVGTISLLEIYASTSLESQHSKHFPTQVWSKVKKSQEMVQKLAEKWEWSEEEMKYSVMEAPSEIVKRLVREGRFEPKLKEKNLVKVKQDMRDAGLLAEDENLNDLFHEKQQVKPLAGEVILEKETSKEVVRKVEIILEGFAQEIDSEWKRRQIQTGLERAASQLFSPEPVEENSDEESDVLEENEEQEDWGADKKRKFKLLKSLIGELPDHQAERFSAIEIFPGLMSYLSYFKDSREQEEKLGEDVIYKRWYNKTILCEDPLECNVLFTKLFQNIQIRSTSEAVAEMVGSIMKNHVGKNRHLRPDNFSKEVVLAVNLGPQHLLEGLVEEVYQARKKEYLYKRDSKGNFMTFRTRLADPNHGSAIRTFRSVEEKKSRFPVDFWKN